MMNFKTAAAFTLVLLSSLTTFAAADNQSVIDCFGSDDPNHTNSLLTLYVDNATGDLSTDDGAELQGEYQADPAQDTAGYLAFKIDGASQDGQQPSEIKVSKTLLLGPNQTAPVWMAPGIQGGAFQCVSSR